MSTTRKFNGRTRIYRQFECPCGATFEHFTSNKKSCDECTKDKQRQRTRDWFARNPDYVKSDARKAQGKDYRLRSKFGITLDEWNQILESQGGHCYFCPSTTLLAVDHDHVTGEIRGILCLQCNTALGKLGDNKESILKVLNYLEGVEARREHRSDSQGQHSSNPLE